VAMVVRECSGIEQPPTDTSTEILKHAPNRTDVITVLWVALKNDDTPVEYMGYI